MYVKWNTTLRVNTLSRLKFGGKHLENHEDANEDILHWMETDVLLLNRTRIETKQNCVLSKILERM